MEESVRKVLNNCLYEPLNFILIWTVHGRRLGAVVPHHPGRAPVQYGKTLHSRHMLASTVITVSSGNLCPIQAVHFLILSHIPNPSFHHNKKVVRISSI
ncbi:hypothetical protein L2E82_27629 [Cichorium intybus]|uniref:Uncharacterized protein n=1 Tax=Cichorium intybus TaxID=13427 RepID=A0ACB9CTS1_CICIN|nr:hypothetical protein L2E82_27629 [Cichorium intybus]